MPLGGVLQSFDAPPGEDVPRGLTYDGTDLWLGGQSNSTIWRLSTSDGSVLQSFSPPGSAFYGLAYDGTDLWAVDAPNDTIYRLDTSDGSSLQSFAAPAAGGVGITHDGADLWFASGTTATIYRLSTSDGSVLQSFSSPGSDPQGITWDGESLWVADSGSDRVDEVDPSDGSTTGTHFGTAGGDFPTGLTWDGTDFWQAEFGTDKIYRLSGTSVIIVEPTSIASAESVGTPSVTGPIAVTASIASAESVGTPTLVVPVRVATPKRRDPQRTDSIRVELLDQHGNILGQLHPAWDRVPTIEVDVSATIPRRLTGVRLDPSEAEEIDVYSHRLRPVWTQAGQDYPMGLFVWSTADRQRDGWGVSLTSGTLHDLTMVLHQPLTESFAADEGATITDRLVALIERYGIVDHSISPSDQTTSSPLSWAAGKPGSKALDALTSKLSYVWWFDRDGLLRAELEPDPDVHAPDWWYEEAHVQPGVGESQDPFLTPNTWLVVNESAEDNDVTGTYRLPQTNRASAEQRGFDVVKVINESGISSTAQADKRARQAADESQTTTQVEIVTTPNPGHDLHDIVAWRGTPYREIGWSLPLDPAGEHSHTLRRRDDAL